MRQRDVYQLTIGEDALDLAPEARVDAIIIADVQEAAAREIVAQPNDLLVAQTDVAVAGDMEERIIPQLVIGESNTRLDLVDIERRPVVDGSQQIRKARGIRVPVPAAVVLETSDGEARRVERRAWSALRRA